MYAECQLSCPIIGTRTRSFLEQLKTAGFWYARSPVSIKENINQMTGIDFVEPYDLPDMPAIKRRGGWCAKDDHLRKQSVLFHNYAADTNKSLKSLDMSQFYDK
jgi:hypothetical protein